MTKRKKHFYNITNTSDLLITPAEDFSIAYRWKWKQTFGFKRIVLELACGKGEYTVGLAPHFSDTLCIGVDIKWDRFSRGIQKANTQGLQNVRFIRGIIQHLEYWFAPGEIDEIRIVHPDPRPKESDEKRRLTSPRFLKMYESLLVSGGTVRLKTDAHALFDYSVHSFAAEGRKNLAMTKDLHRSEFTSDHYGVITDYEKMALDKWVTICYWVRQK